MCVICQFRCETESGRDRCVPENFAAVKIKVAYRRIVLERRWRLGIEKFCRKVEPFSLKANRRCTETYGGR